MTIQTFDFKVTTTTSGGGGFVVNKTKFGEGYTQRTEQGMNNEEQAWRVTWAGYKADALLVMAFIRAHRGAKPFYWTPPLGEEGLYVCEKYDINESGGTHYVISLTFEQGYMP